MYTMNNNLAQYQSLDLSQEIAILNPKRTPFSSFLLQNGKTTKATSPILNWYEETLNSDAILTLKEGSVAPAEVNDSTSLITNFTEILGSKAVVSQTAQNSNIVGVGDLIAREVNKKLILLKDKIETKIMLGTKTAATATDGQTMNGLVNMIHADNVVTGGASLTRSDFELMLKKLYDAKTGDNMVCFLSDINKAVVNSFYPVTYKASENFLGFTCDKYHTEYGDVTFVLCPSLANAKTVVTINPDYLELAELQAANVTDLAKTGNSIEKFIVWEGSLKLLNSKGASKIILT